jgi:hypothetical protein
MDKDLDGGISIPEIAEQFANGFATIVPLSPPFTNAY